MAKCKCKYYLRDKDGVRVCSVCGKPAPGQPQIEDKMQGKHEDKSGKAPLYISAKDKAAMAGSSVVNMPPVNIAKIWPTE